MLQLAETVLPGVAEFGAAGGGRFLVKIVAQGIEAAGVVETRDLDLRIRLAARRGVSDGTGRGDGDVRRADGHGLKTALKRVAVVGDNAAVLVGLQCAVAGVGERTVGQLHLEKSFALDGHVEILAGVREIAGGEHALGGDGHRPLPDLQT